MASCNVMAFCVRRSVLGVYLLFTKYTKQSKSRWYVRWALDIKLGTNKIQKNNSDWICSALASWLPTTLPFSERNAVSTKCIKYFATRKEPIYNLVNEQWQRILNVTCYMHCPSDGINISLGLVECHKYKIEQWISIIYYTIYYLKSNSDTTFTFTP